MALTCVFGRPCSNLTESVTARAGEFLARTRTEIRRRPYNRLAAGNSRHQIRFAAFTTRNGRREDGRASMLTMATIENRSSLPARDDGHVSKAIDFPYSRSSTLWTGPKPSKSSTPSRLEATIASRTSAYWRKSERKASGTLAGSGTGGDG